MSKRLVFGLALVAAVVTYLGVPAFAADEPKEKTITGEGTCAKCGLSETKTCQNAIKVEKGGKTVVYYLVDNDVSKKFHGNICKAPAKVTATGTVAMEDGKHMLTVSKIELAK